MCREMAARSIPLLNQLVAKGSSVWNPTYGQEFLNQVLTGATQLRQAQHGWEHISKAAQRLKIGPGKIIEAIVDHKITRVANRIGWEGFSAIHVCHDDVIAALRPDPPKAKSIEEFANTFGINQPAHLKRMIEDRFVQSTILRNLIT